MSTLLKGLTVTAVSATFAVLAPAHLDAVTPAPPPAATVTLQNDRATPVTVYAEEGDFDQMLGTVNADATATLPLPGPVAWDNGEVVFFVHPKGGFDVATPDVNIGPGSHIGVLVPPAGKIMPENATPAMPDPNPRSPATSVTVRNDGAGTVKVYAEEEQFDTSLGTVSPHSTATLRIPGWLTARDGVVLLAHPGYGIDFTTAPMRITKGRHLGMIVPAL